MLERDYSLLVEEQADRRAAPIDRHGTAQEAVDDLLREIVILTAVFDGQRVPVILESLDLVADLPIASPENGVEHPGMFLDYLVPKLLALHVPLFRRDDREVPHFRVDLPVPLQEPAAPVGRKPGVRQFFKQPLLEREHPIEQERIAPEPTVLGPRRARRFEQPGDLIA